MGRLTLLLCVLAILAVLPSAHLSYAQEWNEGQQKCSKLLTRKEWRTLTNSEKASWVGAVKVRPPTTPVGNAYFADAEYAVLSKHTTRTAIFDDEPDGA
jgi:hypothetical protein